MPKLPTELMALGLGVGIYSLLCFLKSKPSVNSQATTGPKHESKQCSSPVNTASAPRVLRKVETVLSQRTDRVILVLDRPINVFNVAAIMRTVDCLGIQHVWIIDAPKRDPAPRGNDLTRKKPPKGGADRRQHFERVSMQSSQWLSVRHFTTAQECLTALREDGRTIWATSVGKDAQRTDELSPGDVPERLALVMGNEATGVCDKVLRAADRRVYLPLFGFNESLNLGTATALMLQWLLHLCPAIRGSMPEEAKHTLRQEWYGKLARNEEQKTLFLTTYLNEPPAPFGDLREGLPGANDKDASSDVSIGHGASRGGGEEDSEGLLSGVAWHGRREEDFL